MRTLLTPFALTILLAAPSAARPSRAPLDACPARGVPERSDRYDGLILRYAQARRLNPRLVKAVVAAESEFTPWAVSPRGARGLMQVMPATAREMGVPAWRLEEPEPNIRAGTAYLAFLWTETRRRFPRARGRAAERRLLRRAIAAYNAGPRALRDARWRPETRRYVRAVLACYRSEVTALRPGIARPVLLAWAPRRTPAPEIIGF